MKGKKKIPYESLFLVVVVSAVWTLSCVLKGVYPFGDGVLSIGDMSEQSIPVYTFLWDVMHGQKSLFFDWDIGLGNNMAGVVSHFTLISPFNLFLLLVKRSAIESSMFYFFLIKIVAIVLSVRYVFRKWFPELDAQLLCTFCILYAFCPFLVEYYRVPSWYDIVFIFPFVMYYYVEMMSGRKRGIAYALSLALMAMMSFQHTFMLVILLILMTGGLLVIDKEKYGASMSRFVGYSILAAMLSACVFLPGTLQIMTAGRLDGKFDLLAILESVYIFHPEKWMKLINLGIPLGLTLCGMRKCWKDRDFRWLIYVDLMLLLPIVLESTNMLWHGGPYEGYSMRFAYMLTFWVLVTGIYSYQRSREKGCHSEQTTLRGQSIPDVQNMQSDGAQKKDRTHKRLWPILFIVLLLMLGVILYYMATHETSIAMIALVAIVSMAAAVLVFHVDTVLYGRGILIAAIAVSITIFYDNIRIEEYVDDSGVRFYNMLRETEFGEDRQVLDRIKNLNITSQNYPQLMGRSAIGNYTASEAYEQIYSVVDMGYALVGNRMSDWGGTVFSDALLGITQAMVSGETVDSRLYTENTQKEHYQIYDCNYRYENGILIRQDWDASAKKAGNPFVLQNEMANSILGTELITLYEMRTDTLKIPVKDQSVLYVYVPGDPRPALSVEKIEIQNSETGEVKQREFTSGWENGIVNLGIYEEEELHITVEKTSKIETVYFALLSIDKLEEYEPLYVQNFQYTTTGHALDASLTDVVEGDRLFLPIYHDGGWSCRINGEIVKIETFLSGGMVIPLTGGDNHIKLQYCPPGLRTGILCSLLGTVILIGLWKIPAWERKMLEKTDQIARYLLLLVWGIFMIVFYLLPAVFLVRFLVKWVFHL